MSVSESTITNPKKRLEFYRNLSEQLQQENKALKEQLEYLRSGEYLNQLTFERNMLQDLVDSGEISKEDKEFIDMTHRNTELLEQLKQRDEVIDKAINKLGRYADEMYYSHNGNAYAICVNLLDTLKKIQRR